MTAFVHVVTPCMNAAATIDRTITSVVTQAGDFKLRFHVQDGGSTDGTLAILEDWRRRLGGEGFLRQCHGIRFTYTSARDLGMYDALVKAFAEVDAHADSFMTWINADDILMPGALALAAALERQFPPAQLSWFGGAVCNINDDMTTVSFDRPIPRAALREGICDGVHWDYLQQEGTFFRKWLWGAVNPARSIASMKLAGDWNLWRLMAEKAGFAQVVFPLGGFRVSEGQLSAAQKDKYLGEIDCLAPVVQRRDKMEAVLAVGPVIRNRIRRIKGSTFSIVEECVDGFARHRYQQVHGKAPIWARRQPPADNLLAEGRQISHKSVQPRQREFPEISPWLLKQPGLVALDKDWQFPAVTEQHAFAQIRSRVRRLPPGVLYVAFPWATLIDKLQNKAKDRDMHLDRFEQFCAQLPPEAMKATVCQHIYARNYLHLFETAGISDLFWSHATKADAQAAATGGSGIRLRPFPLYPVQVPEMLPEAAPEADTAPRSSLFSFIGARANQYYLTQSRNWILDLLSSDKRGLIIGRDAWHYQKVVYELQVGTGKTGIEAKGDARLLVDSGASDEFRDSLLRSVFALCPSGSGPNSIRLWESIGAGTIPVVMADSWAPPGDPRLWELAAVFCAENPDAIKALPARLAALAADPQALARMRHALRQLWLLYGPQSFVTDVEQWLLAPPEVTSPTTTAAKAPASDSGALGLGPSQTLLRFAGDVLLDPAAALDAMSADTELSDSIRRSRSELSDETPIARHFDSVLAAAHRKIEPALPMISRGSRPRVALFGRHSHRTPMSYAPMRRLIGDRLTWVDDPGKADLIVSGFNVDLVENAATLVPLLGRPKPPKLAIFSEEPLWDVTWSGPFTGRDGRVTVNGREIRYDFIGHETSPIYDFTLIPYFVLSDDRYAVRYANLMARFADVAPAELLARWKAAPVRTAFFAEKRSGEAYSGKFDARDVARLSSYRSEIAAAFSGPGSLCVGKGWGAEVLRQDLPDWHLDKLAQLDGRAFVVSSYENVHQRSYISEKVFDAFAVGALPTYWASPQHRIHDLVPEQAMLNTYSLTAGDAVRHIAGFVPDKDVATAWLVTAARLAALFGDFEAIQAERQRVADAVVDEVLGLV